MKKWIIIIMQSALQVDRMMERLDILNERAALNFKGKTMDTVNEILAINEKKRKLVNLNVLNGSMLKALNPEQIKMISAYARGRSMMNIGEEMGISKSGVFRKLQIIAEKCANVLKRLGFDERRLEREFGDIFLVKQLYKNLNRRHVCKEASRNSYYRELIDGNAATYSIV